MAFAVALLPEAFFRAGAFVAFAALELFFFADVVFAVLRAVMAADPSEVGPW